ncbi:unnamed protein product [Danaus chrysippus]|uniref:(African queen) hypothetical protein n=1 Tax=Danaus chrysippus TaxID=151541 RepID=A0A8J2W6R7_9NEOP|nr:unnamed protein product [Danaus chrysippus]
MTNRDGLCRDSVAPPLAVGDVMSISVLSENARAEDLCACVSMQGAAMCACVVEARSLCLPRGTVAGERPALTCVANRLPRWLPTYINISWCFPTVHWC